MVVDGWKLRTMIEDGVFTSHQVPEVPSVAGAEACRNCARGEGLVPIQGELTASHYDLLLVNQSVHPSPLDCGFDPNLHYRPRDCCDLPRLGSHAALPLRVPP